MSILNLTQHLATPEQAEAGVIDLPSGYRKRACKLLTFESIPTQEEIEQRAEDLADIASEFDAEAVMIGGAPYLMAELESELRKKGKEPVYAFSKRESVEETQDDGSVVKRNVFKHIGFVRGYYSE